MSDIDSEYFAEFKTGVNNAWHVVQNTWKIDLKENTKRFSWDGDGGDRIEEIKVNGEVLKVKDAEGHEHASDGKFTSGSGGPGKNPSSLLENFSLGPSKPRSIDLIEIASEDNFSAFTNTCYDSFNFVRCQVLGFIHNKEDALQASSPYETQRFDHQFLLFGQLGNCLTCFIGFGKLVLNYAKIVPQRLHIGSKLAVHVSGKITDIFIAEGNNRSRDVDLAIIFPHFKCSGKGKKCFPRSGLSR